jgi:hypothetical protein
MKRTLRTGATVALFATSLWAQTPGSGSASASTPQERLARAQLIAAQEHDVAGAEAAYRALLDDPAASAVHGASALQLGAMLWRLDQRDAAKPFLERAVAAGGETGAAATAILQGQGDDAKLAQQRLTKARALVALFADLHSGARDEKGRLVDDLDGRRRSTVRADLRTLGAQAAEAITEHLETMLGAGKVTRFPGDEVVRQRLLSLLSLVWELGTEPAAKALRRWSEREDVMLRRAVAEATPTCVAADLQPVLLQYLRDPDPSEEVWRLSARKVERLPTERVIELAVSVEAPLRSAGLAGLAKYWPGMELAQQDAFVAAHAPSVRDATSHTDVRVVNAAWRLLHEFAHGPTSATYVFFAEADRYASDTGVKNVENVTADDRWLRAIADAASRVRKSATPATSYLLGNLLNNARPTWASASVDAAIDLLERDFVWGDASRTLTLADDQQLARVIPLLPLLGESAVAQLLERPTPAVALPALRALIERDLVGEKPFRTAPEKRMRIVAGRNVTVDVPNRTTEQLLLLAARTGTPEGATWLVELVDRHPTAASLVAHSLGQMMSGASRATALAALRKLLVWEGTAQNALQPDERSGIFACLARAGDVDAIPLFVRAYELGLARTSGYSALRADEFQTWGHHQASGIGWLCEPISARGPKDAWHGYADADLLRAWATLLDSSEPPRVLAEFSRSLDPRPGTATTNTAQIAIQVPLVVLPLVLERLPRLLGAIADPSSRNEVRNTLAWQPITRLSPDRIQADAALRQAMAATFRSEDPQLGELFAALPNSMVAAFADDGRAALRRTGSVHALAKLVAANVAMDDDDWRAVLTSSMLGLRRAALESIPAGAGTRLRTEFEANLRHEDADVRKVACAAVQRTFGADAAPLLFPLLQDQQPAVRAAARASLDTLREEHERRAFWANANSGVDVSAAGATARLVAQARPGTGVTKEQRVLALQSLAALGAPEALPYLIEWTQDTDTDVAAAARAAITRIHQKAGLPAAK